MGSNRVRRLKNLTKKQKERMQKNKEKIEQKKEKNNSKNFSQHTECRIRNFSAYCTIPTRLNLSPSPLPARNVT